MFPELKEIYSREIFTELDKYYPKNEDFFELELILIVGIKGQEGGDCFYLNICSPKWINLLYETQGKLPSQGYLVVEKYDILNIKKS